MAGSFFQRVWLCLCGTALLSPAARASAQAAAEAPAAQPAQHDESGLISAYFKAFAGKKLVSVQTAPVAELRRQLSAAEELAGSGREADAVLMLFELSLHPRFADYADLEEMDAANYALGSALHALGAEPSARVALARVLKKGPQNPYFAPAYRRYVDVILAAGPLDKGLTELAPFSSSVTAAAAGPAPQAPRLPASAGGNLPEDAQNELYYVQARERHEANDLSAAKLAYERISRHSRFYANAQYQLGALAARERAWKEAEMRFCRIADTGDNGRFSYYVDARYFRIKDLARLGLGRVAHEQRRGDDAFYYYFQVPNDSPRLPESMFEAAYARYEAGDFEGAIDLLDQLEARFPHSAYADEASLLRGYVALSHCDYESADKHFQRFGVHFTPVIEEIDRILKNPERRAALYEELRVRGRGDVGTKPSAVHRSLLALLRIDPDFNDLHERLIQLDGEAARSGQLPASFALLEARYEGSDRPRPVAGDQPSARAELEVLGSELGDARRAVRALTEQLDAMRALGAKAAQLAPIEQLLAGLATRLRKLESQLEDVRVETLPADEAELAPGADIAQLLQRDRTRAAAFGRRVASLRPRLVQAANERALAELRALRDRLGGFLRRARIGRIDSVMGSKRRVERQIESLAAGRFPPELRDPLLVQGFLRDNEEYWPFEGEDWPDEYVERYGDEAPQGAP